MNDTRKPQLILVIAANLVLSLGIGLAILNGNSSHKSPERAGKVSQVSKLDSDTSASSQSLAVKAGAESVTAPQAKFPATTRGAALERAKTAAKHRDPMASFSSHSQYPESHNQLVSETVETVSEHSSKQQDASNESENTTAPLTALHAKSRTIMHVPPPPPLIGAAPAPGFGFQGKLAGITVTAVMGNKAMLKLRREGMRKNEKPEVVCLAPGEQIRTYNNLSLSVVAVEPYRVTLDVDGDRFVKSLPEIK